MRPAVAREIHRQGGIRRITAGQSGHAVRLAAEQGQPDSRELGGTGGERVRQRLRARCEEGCTSAAGTWTPRSPPAAPAARCGAPRRWCPAQRAASHGVRSTDEGGFSEQRLRIQLRQNFDRDARRDDCHGQHAVTLVVDVLTDQVHSPCVGEQILVSEFMNITCNRKNRYDKFDRNLSRLESARRTPAARRTAPRRRLAAPRNASEQPLRPQCGRSAAMQKYVRLTTVGGDTFICVNTAQRQRWYSLGHSLQPNK